MSDNSGGGMSIDEMLQHAAEQFGQGAIRSISFSLMIGCHFCGRRILSGYEVREGSVIHMRRDGKPSISCEECTAKLREIFENS